MKLKNFVVVFSSILLLAAASTSWANDNIVSTVTIPTGQPQPIIEDNGVASGTIRLDYTWSASSCSTGPFAQFNLNFSDQSGTGQSGVYPSTLSLAVSGGGTPEQLSPSSPILGVSGVGWTGSSLVTVNIARCDTFADGATLDGQLNLSVAPSSGTRNPHIDTITTIQVHITVEVPGAACLRLYSFESDQDTGDLITSVGVNAKKNESITNTVPGQISVDGLVSNACSSELSFDLKINLDPDWGTNPSSPGNATFTYTTTGEYDPSTYNLTAFGTGTAQGTALCLQNVTLAAGDSFLTRVHSGILDGLTTSNLPNPTAGNFTLEAGIYALGSGCATDYPTPSIIGPSNPAQSTLSYTVQ